ncbi:hypothetical protein J3459_002431 [Metarhizium acridum]|nr:hypothetical protein J3459_002431 [Metarhizium acridum]
MQTSSRSPYSHLVNDKAEVMPEAYNVRRAPGRSRSNKFYLRRRVTRTNEDESSSTYILKLPGDASWLRIRFPEAYPAQPPLILGTHHSSGGVRGAGARDLRLFKDAVHSVFQEGSVCLFDAVEEFGRRVEERPPEEPRDGPEHEEAAAGEEEEQEDPFPAPDWTLSEVVVENKSTFVARVARASSPGEARSHVASLLASDKKVRAGDAQYHGVEDTRPTGHAVPGLR